MNTNTNSTNGGDRRNDVSVLVAATRAALDGFEQAIREDLERMRAFLDDAESWAQVGGRKPTSVTRYTRLAAAAYEGCCCTRANSCKHCKASNDLGERYRGRTGAADDLDPRVFAVFEMIAGDGPDLDDAMDALLDAVGNATNNPRLTEDIVTHAYAVAGYVPPVREIADDEADGSECSQVVDRDDAVASLENARTNKELANHDAAINKLEKETAARRVEINAMTKLVEGMLPARARHLTLVVSNDVRRSD
jgi:hypothetical protein